MANFTFFSASLFLFLFLLIGWGHTMYFHILTLCKSLANIYMWHFLPWLSTLSYKDFSKVGWYSCKASPIYSISLQCIVTISRPSSCGHSFVHAERIPSLLYSWHNAWRNNLKTLIVPHPLDIALYFLIKLY